MNRTLSPVAERDMISARLSELRAIAAQGALSDEQIDEAEQLSDRHGALQRQIDADAQQRQAARIQAQRVRSTDVTGVGRAGGSSRSVWHISGGERQYRADDAQTGQPTYIGDLYRSQVLRDPAAGERIARHGQEVLTDNPDFQARAVGTSAVPGFVPPQYLAELWADISRGGRPVANLCTPLPLPEQGMEVDVPKLTVGTATGAQTSENTPITTQDPDSDTLKAQVVTIAGYVDLSRQSIERGQLVESIVFGDLAATYNQQLDTQVIAGTGNGSNGNHRGILGVTGINSITYTDSSPTVGELWPKIADAGRKVVSQRLTGPTAYVIHPDVWGWMLAATDTTGRPLIDANGTGSNASGTLSALSYDGIAGHLFGNVPVVLSANIPTNLGTGTNESRIIAADFRDLLLFETPNGGPIQLRFDDVLSSSLGVRLVAYGYTAFEPRRQPKAISVISGTGLIGANLTL